MADEDFRMDSADLIQLQISFSQHFQKFGKGEQWRTVGPGLDRLVTFFSNKMRKL